MIYLICAKDTKQRIVELNNKDDYKTNKFYKYFVDSFKHENVLYSLDFYNQTIKEVLPDRVNVIFALNRSGRLPNIVNGIVTRNVKNITRTYKNSIDDVYIFCSDKMFIEYFVRYADYVIVYTSDDIGYSMSILSDSIDFSNFDLLRTQELEKCHIEYYVSNKIGKK